MGKLIYRLRYATHYWRRVRDWRLAWYCSGVGWEQGDKSDPIEDADSEISYIES